jgi:hypothetical protein
LRVEPIYLQTCPLTCPARFSLSIFSTPPLRLRAASTSSRYDRIPNPANLPDLEIHDWIWPTFALCPSPMVKREQKRKKKRQNRKE